MDAAPLRVLEFLRRGAFPYLSVRESLGRKPIEFEKEGELDSARNREIFEMAVAGTKEDCYKGKWDEFEETAVKGWREVWDIEMR